MSAILPVTCRASTQRRNITPPGSAGAAAQLRGIAADFTQPPIARAKALAGLDPAAAIASLEAAQTTHLDDRDILQALASFHAERGYADEAHDYALRLQGLSE